MLVLSTVVTIWFTFGGIRDLREMFASLINLVRNPNDNGMLQEEVMEEQSRE